MTEYVIDLRTRNHLFREDHRIMVQVQSNWFPLIDRNPQTFTDIPGAEVSDSRSAEHRVHFTTEHPSRLRPSTPGRDSNSGPGVW